MSKTSNNNEEKIIEGPEFSPETDYKYVKPKINKSGGKSVGILNSKSNRALYISTPLMLTWGVSEFKDDMSGKKSYDMSLQFPKDEYSNEQTNKFLKSMVDFESKIKKDAIENSKEWLNKPKITMDVVEALFHPMLKYPKDPDTGEPNTSKSPTLRIKLDYWEDEFNCEIYDVENKLIFPVDDSTDGPLELIPKAVNVAVIIRCGGLWFANGKFGCTWRLEQAVVQPRKTIKGKCLIKLTDDDVNKLKTEANKEDQEEEHDDDEQVKNNSTVIKTTVNDSEEEEEEEEEKEEKEEPKPKPKKRKIVRRKVTASK